MQRRQSGFTLIVLMFILAFLAIIFMYGVSMARDQAREDAITNTAIGIKNWLQAALAYYADNNKWPDDLNSDLVGVYLPARLACTQFAGQTSGGACTIGNTSYTGAIGSDGKYYTVSADVSDNATAKAIAGKLPASEVDNLKVSSSVPIPGAKQGYITSAGLVALAGMTAVPTLQNVWVPPCQPGFEGHYLLTPQYYTTGFSKNGGSDDTSLGFNVILGLSNIQVKNGRYYVYSNTNFADTSSQLFGLIDGSTHYYAYYMTFCLPEGNDSAGRARWDSSDCSGFKSGSTDCQQS